MASPTEGPVLEGDGKSDYDRYIRVTELLNLQKDADEMAHPDELIFQVEHQAMELWFKVTLQGVERAAAHVDADEPLQAERLLERGCRIIEMLSDQLLILNTMPPWDYHTIRLRLGRGSGAESPGFQRISTEPRKLLWPAFLELLERRKVDLEDVYVHHNEHYDLFRLAEALTDFDMHYQMWRQKHVTFIKRVIGRNVHSLKGYSVHELEDAVSTALFPELWTLRDTLTKRAGTSPSYG